MTRVAGQQGNSPKKMAKLNILRLYRQGKTKQEIAQIYGMTVQGVAAIITRAGVRRPTTTQETET